MIAFFVKLAETGWSLGQYKVWLWRLHWFTDHTIRWVLVSFVAMLITIWGCSAVGILWRIICQSPPDCIFFFLTRVLNMLLIKFAKFFFRTVLNMLFTKFAKLFQDRTKYVISWIKFAKFVQDRTGKLVYVQKTSDRNSPSFCGPRRLVKGTSSR